MKILIMSNSLNLNSGFSKVAENMILGLRGLGHAVWFVGMQTSYTPRIYKIKFNGVGEDVGELPLISRDFDEYTQFGIILQKILPDVVIDIFQSDGGAGPGLENFVTMFKNTVWYTVVEGDGLGKVQRTVFRKVLEGGGRIVLPSIHGIIQCEEEDGLKEFIRKGIDLIPYGVDLDNDLDLDLDKKNKNDDEIVPVHEIVPLMIWNKDGKSWEQHNIRINELERYRRFDLKFIFGSVKQNVGVRHRMERLIGAFAKFIGVLSKQDKDRVLLHLHTMPYSMGGVDLLDIIKRIGKKCGMSVGKLEESIIFSYGDYRSSGWSDNGLKLLYNTFDCYVSASSGEGWGIPTVEAMACGIPIIAPRASSFNELVFNGGFDRGFEGRFCSGPRGLSCSGIYQMIEDGSSRFLVDEEDMASKMLEMYKDKDLRDRLGSNCSEFAKRFGWDKCIGKWDKLLKDFVGK